MGRDAGFRRREREAARAENRIGDDRRVAARGRLSNGRWHSNSARLLSHREHGAGELARRLYHHREAHTGGSAPSARALQHSYTLGLLNFLRTTQAYGSSAATNSVSFVASTLQARTAGHSSSAS